MLTPRERQIMLLCSGQRPLSVLIELFGHAVVRELHALAVRGCVQAIYGSPDAAPLAPAIVPGPPRAHTRLMQTHEFATAVAQSLNSAEAIALVRAHRAATGPDEVLSYAAAVIELLFRGGDMLRVKRVGYKLADLLPRDRVPQLIDHLLDSADPQLAAALYEHLLADRDLPAPDRWHRPLTLIHRAPRSGHQPIRQRTRGEWRTGRPGVRRRAMPLHGDAGGVESVLTAGEQRAHQARQHVARARRGQAGVSGRVDARHLARCGDDAAGALEHHDALKALGQRLCGTQPV